MTNRVLRCDICNTEVQPTSWTSHLQGKRHFKQMASVGKQRDPNRVEGQPTTSSVKSEPVKRQSPKQDPVNTKRPRLGMVTEQLPASGVGSLQPSTPAGPVNTPPRQGFVATQQLRPAGPVNRQPPKPGPVNRQPPKSESTFLLEKETFEKLCSYKTIDEQVDFLVKTFGIRSSDYAQRDNLCRMLENLIGEFFPGFTLTTFGSYANNLAMTGKSDVDLYLEFNFETADEMPSDEEMASLKTILRTLNFIRYKNKQWFLNTVKGMTLRSLIQIVGAIIRRFGQGCQNVVCIPMAYCPIVKFYHRNSKLNCDLSMNNRLAAENTKLLLFYQTLDPRVHPLIFAIRFWAKCNKLCIDNRAKISSYALSMLGVFYLQNCNPAILPTVQQLQLLDTQPMIGWNYHFCQDVTKIPMTRNTDSIELLLKGFFTFYSKVNWKLNVICPWNGKIVQKDIFFEENLNTPFKLKSLNVQDPFQLDRNIAMSTTDKLSDLFVELITKSNEILTSETGANVPGIAAILNLSVEKKVTEAVAKNRAIPVLSSLAPVPNPFLKATVSSMQFRNGSIDFPVTLNESVLNLYPDIFKAKKIVVDDNLRFVLLTRLVNVVKTIFEKVLKINCTSLKTESVNPKRQHNGSDTTHPNKVQVVEHNETKATVLPVVRLENETTNLKKEISETRDNIDSDSSTDFLCKVYHRTWINRKKFRSILVQQLLTQSIMEVEEKISQLVIESEGGQIPRIPLFTFECSLRELNSTDKLGLQIKLGLAHSKEFKGHFIPFLQSFVGKIANMAFVSMPKITFPSSADVNM